MTLEFKELILKHVKSGYAEPSDVAGSLISRLEPFLALGAIFRLKGGTSGVSSQLLGIKVPKV